jgi:protein O-mannosyl-transferase
VTEPEFGGLPRGAPEASPARTWLGWAIPLAIALVGMLAFLPGLDGAFLDWDDRENFLHNPHYRGLGPTKVHWMFTSGLLGHWIPLTWLSLALDWHVWGMDPFGYHLTSLLLHGLAAALFYLVARRLLEAARPHPGDAALTVGAAVAALLFAIHPLRAESVAWITERRDVLAGVFFLGATLAYLGRWTPGGAPHPRGGLRYLASLALFVGALGSKSMTVTLPAVLLILDVYPLRRLGPAAGGWIGGAARRVWLEKAPFVLLGGAAAAIVISINRDLGNLAPMDRIGILDRLAISAYSLVFYLWKTVVPLGLSPMYELPDPIEPWRWPFVGSALAIVAVTAVAIALARRRPALLAAWAAYVLMALPVAGLVQNGFQIAADRYTYLPCLPWALLAGGGVASLVRGDSSRRTRLVPVGAALAVAAFILLGTMTWQQTRVWHDTETLWRRALAIAPSSVAHSNLGLTLARGGNAEAAIPHYREAIRLRPSYAEAWSNLGLAQAQRGDLPGAATSLQEAIRLKPRYSAAWSNLGIVRAKQGQSGEAIAAYREALRLQPNNAEAHGNLGATLDGQGQGEEALRHLQEAARLRPDSADAQGNLGIFFARRGDVPTAARYFGEALRLRPDSPEAHNNLGLALAQQGRLDVAAAHFREAVRLRPAFKDAQVNLARAQALMGGQ